MEYAEIVERNNRFLWFIVQIDTFNWKKNVTNTLIGCQDPVTAVVDQWLIVSYYADFS